jgi:hypothetical protein
MTRKDYEIIAVALGQALAESPTHGVITGVQKSVEHISHALQVAEPRFDAKKFKAYVQKICYENQ